MGKHRSIGGRKVAAGGSRVGVSERRPRAERRGVKAAVSAATIAAAAVGGAVVLGAAPTLSVSPQLAASLHYLRGTNIGGIPTDQQYEDFITTVIDGSGVTEPDGPYQKVPYNAGFRPFSHGGFDDLSYDDSVEQGLQLLAAQQPAPGDVIFGFSQGAVVASLYKGTHTGNTYILVGNPNRPNGGVMQRFTGAKIPLLDVTFSGATPNNGVGGEPGDLTIDVTRQYDGWADFPRYLWNPLAIANAIAGIALIHGATQFELTAEQLEEAKASGDSDYYQFDADSNTHYYVIRTYPIPLLMPLDPFLSDSAMAALDAPLRRFIETAYDRSDYSEPARASLFKPWGADRSSAQTADVAEATEPVDTESVESDEDDTPHATPRTSNKRGADAENQEIDEALSDAAEEQQSTVDEEDQPDSTDTDTETDSSPDTETDGAPDDDGADTAA